jgi:Zn-dependent protease
VILALAIVLGSALAHELGHVAATYYYGGHFKGLGHSRRWMAIGIVAVLPDKTNVWKIAAAGPAVSLVLTGLFWLAYPGAYATIGLVTNWCLFAINMLPISIADGGHILRSLRSGRYVTDPFDKEGTND